MLDINNKEADKLYQWACDNHTKELEEKYFSKFDKDCKSYYEKKSLQEEYCKEYTFQTMPELRSELSAMWKDDAIMEQIQKVVLVAAMKNKPEINKSDENTKEKMEQIKPYIYNF